MPVTLEPGSWGRRWRQIGSSSSLAAQPSPTDALQVWETSAQKWGTEQLKKRATTSGFLIDTSEHTYINTKTAHGGGVRQTDRQRQRGELFIEPLLSTGHSRTYQEYNCEQGLISWNFVLENVCFMFPTSEIPFSPNSLTANASSHLRAKERKDKFIIEEILFSLWTSKWLWV